MEQRPPQNDQCVMDAFYAAMAEALSIDSNMAKGMSLEEIEKGLRYAGSPESDGYAYAKRLEQCGWEGITSQDVETLDCAYGFLIRAMSDAEAQWVMRNNIQPQFESGAMVRAKVMRLIPGSRRMKVSIVEGRAHLDEHRSKTGHCTFRDAEWIAAHGDQGGFIIPFESVETI